MADTTGITKNYKLECYNVHLLSTPRTPYFGISRPRQNTYFAADHNRQNGKQTTNQSIKISYEYSENSSPQFKHNQYNIT